MSTLPIPTAADWTANPAGAAAAAALLFHQTASDAVIAASIVAQLQPVLSSSLSVLAPIVGAAVAASPAGPAVGALAAAGIAALAQGVAPAAPPALLTPLQQAIATVAVQEAMTAIQKIPKATVAYAMPQSGGSLAQKGG